MSRLHSSVSPPHSLTHSAHLPTHIRTHTPSDLIVCPWGCSDTNKAKFKVDTTPLNTPHPYTDVFARGKKFMELHSALFVCKCACGRVCMLIGYVCVFKLNCI